MEQPFESRERICRLCLGTLGYFVNIFDNRLEMDNLATKIMRCATIEVKKSDGLPDSVCHRCVAKVESSCEFRLLCETSDAKLRRLLLPKILGAEKYDDVEREQKQILNCDFNEQTLNETSSEEITILFVSSKLTSTPRGNITKVSEVSGYTSESKRESICSISKSCHIPEPDLSNHSVQEHAIEYISVPQSYSASSQQVCVDVKHFDQCSESVTGECDSQHLNADHNSDSVSKDNFQVECIPEKLSHECYDGSSSLESIPETNPIELHEEQTSTSFTVNEHSIQSKENSSSASTIDLEVISEHARVDPPVNTNIPLTSERDSFFPLSRDKTPSEHSQKENCETISSLPPCERLSYLEKTNTTDEGSGIDSESVLPSCEPPSEQEETDIHSNARDILELDCSSELPLQGANPLNNSICLSMRQPNTETPLKLLRQPQHESTENAAMALIMLSNSVDKSTSVPDKSLGTRNLEDKQMHVENVERTTEKNANMLDACLTTLSLIQTETNLLHSIEKDTKSNIRNKRPEKHLSNKSINMKIKRISGKYSIEKVGDYQFDVSTCKTTNRSDTASGDAQAGIASEEARKTKRVNNDILNARKQVSTTLNHVSVRSSQRHEPSEPLSESETPSGEETNNTNLNRYPSPLTHQSLNSQLNTLADLKKDITMANSKTTNIRHLAEELRKQLLQTTHRDKAVQQKNTTDFKELENSAKVHVTATEFHAGAFPLARNNVREQRDTQESTSENVESEIFFSSNVDSGGNSKTKNKPRKRAYKKSDYSYRKRKSHIVTKRKFKNCHNYVTSIDQQHLTENNAKTTCHETSNRQVSETIERLTNNDETFSDQTHDAFSFEGRATEIAQSVGDGFSRKELNICLRRSENNTLKHKKKTYDIYDVGINSPTNQNEHGHTFISSSPVKTNTSKTVCKTEQPLKELRVFLVRLEMDANGHYLNACKGVNNESLKASELRLQSSISNSPQQSALSNSYSLEEDRKKQTLCIKSGAQDLDRPSTKVSHRRPRRARHKRNIRATKEQDIKSNILSLPSPLSSPLPDSTLTDVGEHANRSVDDSNTDKEVRCKSPRITSENTRNGLVKTMEVRSTLARRHDDAANGNTIARSKSKVLSAFDQVEEATTCKHNCSKHIEGKLDTSSLTFDSRIITKNVQCGDPNNLNDDIDQSDTQEYASTNTNDNTTNIFRERKSTSSTKRREASVVSTINKQMHERVSDTSLKICVQTDKVSNNYKYCTPSEINNSKKADVTINHYSSRDGMQVRNCDNASSLTEMNKNIENITSQTICRETFRTPRTSSFENYRKIRQSELHRSSELKTTSNSKHDMNDVQAYSSSIVKDSHSNGRNTAYRHAGKNTYISQRLQSSFADQRGLDISKDTNSLNPCANSEQWQQKETWRARTNVLGNLCIKSKNETASFNEKHKMARSWNSVFQKQKQNKCQQILQFTSESPSGHKQLFEKCRNMIKGMRKFRCHGGNGEEQCNIIRKEILKTAYLTPQLAVLTADTLIQSPTLWFEEIHPRTEPVFSGGTNVCRSSLSSDIRDRECFENSVASNELYESENQAKNPENKSEDAQTNQNSLDMDSGISRLALKESEDSLKIITSGSKILMNEKTHGLERKDEISINGQNSGKAAEGSTIKSVIPSCTLEEQLNTGKHDTVLRNCSKKINCTTGTICLSLKCKANDTIVQQYHKDDGLVEDQSTSLPREVHCYDNAPKAIGNPKGNTRSKIENTTATHTSEEQVNLLGIQDNPKTSNVYSSLEHKRNESFSSSATSQNIIGNVTLMNNSPEQKQRKGLKRKKEYSDQNAGGTLQQNKSNITETTVQALSLIEKQMSVSGALDHESFGDLLREQNACKDTKQEVQERNVHRNTDITPLQLSIGAKNPASLSFVGGKAQHAVSETFETVINESDSVCPTDKKSSGQKSNSVTLDLNVEQVSTGDTDFVPVCETVTQCGLPDDNSKSSSNDSSKAALNKGHLLVFPTNAPNSFDNQLRHELNVSSSVPKNDENQAPKRVCYTSNFIRKDLSERNMPSKAESRRLVLSKAPLLLEKTTKIDRRSKSQESRLNIKPDVKIRANISRRKSAAICTTFHDSSAFTELSHYQGESNKTLLCEQKLAAESVSTSVPRTRKGRFAGHNVLKNSTNSKHSSEIRSDIAHYQTFNTLDMFNCIRNSILDELRKEVKIRPTEDTLKVNPSFLSNDDSQYLNAKFSDIASKRDQSRHWVDANSSFASKAISEKQISSTLAPEVSTRSTDEKTLHAQKAPTTVTDTCHSNTALQKKRIDQTNACDFRSERFASQHYFMKHQQSQEVSRKRLYRNNNYKSIWPLRGHLKARDTNRPYNSRRNRPLRQCWRIASDINERFRSKRNGRQSFYRKTGFRNTGNGALSRMNESIPSWKSRRCRTCGKWFANGLLLSRHFKNGCNPLEVIPGVHPASELSTRCGPQVYCTLAKQNQSRTSSDTL